MKAKYIQFILIISFLILVASCEKNADNAEIPEYTPKLVLHAFISPSDTVLKVHVSATNNIYGEVHVNKSIPVLLNLIDNGHLFPFSERDSAGFCSLRYSVEPGKEYKIIAHCNGFPDAYGICKVPGIKNMDISVDTITYNYIYEFGTFQVLKIKVRFKDFPNENNFYNIFGLSTSYYTNDTTNYYVTIENEKDNYETKTYKLLSDHLIDGQEIVTYFNYFDIYSLSDTTLLSKKFTAQILCTDEDYYRYHISLPNYKNGDEPFTEFSPVYSNINGGYGIIASYNWYKKTFLFK